MAARGRADNIPGDRKRESERRKREMIINKVCVPVDDKSKILFTFLIAFFSSFIFCDVARTEGKHL